VLVPSYRRPDALLSCLDGLLAGTRLPEHIVVVLRDTDAGSHAALEAWLAEHAQGQALVDLAEVSEPGQCAATNAGLAIATGEIVCFIDDDCVPSAQWLERLLAHYADPRVIGAGGRDVVHHGDEVEFTPQPIVGRLTWYGRTIGNHHQPAFTEPRRVQHLKGANMSFRRSAISGFDPRIRGAHFSDTDVSLTAGRSGALLYDPLAQVDHYPAARTGGFARQPERAEEIAADAHDGAYVMLKHLRGLRAAGFVAFMLLIGRRRSCGLLRMIAAFPRERWSAVRRWRAAMAGLRAGMRTAREAARR